MSNEFYYSQLAFNQGWHPFSLDITTQNYTSIIVGVILPWLSKLTTIDLVWIYKIVPPLFLALVPVILYYVYAKMLTRKQAFLATIFFYIMPVTLLEIIQISKSMFAQVFFATALLFMVNNWKWQYKLIGITSSIIAAIFCHYTVGIMLLFYLGTITIIRIISKPIKWQLVARSKVPIVALIVITVLSVGSFYAYYSYAAEGVLVSVVNKIVTKYTPISLPYDTRLVTPDDAALAQLQDATTLLKQRGVESYNRNAETDDGFIKSQINMITHQPMAVKAGIGLDFFDVSISGKLFRVIQYITELLIVIGAVGLLLGYKKHRFTTEFLAGIAGSFIILACCVFIPLFSCMINMTRFYQMSLFFLAPLVPIGIEVFTNIRKTHIIVRSNGGTE
jgi:uncharacterized membrane protein